MLTTGWPIVCAIDIAAAYYMLKTMLPRSGALPFALLLGIATDAFGILVIAPRHPVLSSHAGGVTLLVLALGLAALLRTMKVRVFWPYLGVCGTLAWVAFYWEGLHPAFALVPIVPFLRHEPRRLDLFADPPDDDAVHHFEHEWNTAVQLILFLFGLVNAGVTAPGRLRHRYVGPAGRRTGRAAIGDSPGGRRGGSGRPAFAAADWLARDRRDRPRVVDWIHDRALLCHRDSVERPGAFTTHCRRARHGSRRAARTRRRTSSPRRTLCIMTGQARLQCLFV